MFLVLPGIWPISEGGLELVSGWIAFSNVRYMSSSSDLQTVARDLLGGLKNKGVKTADKFFFNNAVSSVVFHH